MTTGSRAFVRFAPEPTVLIPAASRFAAVSIIDWSPHAAAPQSLMWFAACAMTSYPAYFNPSATAATPPRLKVSIHPVGTTASETVESSVPTVMSAPDSTGSSARNGSVQSPPRSVTAASVQRAGMTSPVNSSVVTGSTVGCGVAAGRAVALGSTGVGVDAESSATSQVSAVTAAQLIAAMKGIRRTCEIVPLQERELRNPLFTWRSPARNRDHRRLYAQQAARGTTCSTES